MLVIGPAVAERDVHCAVNGLAPDWPMPVYRVERAGVHPGAAALTAATAANLGAQATLLAPVGRAAAAERRACTRISQPRSSASGSRAQHRRVIQVGTGVADINPPAAGG